jgi:hypothetical protein
VPHQAKVLWYLVSKRVLICFVMFPLLTSQVLCVIVNLTDKVLSFVEAKKLLKGKASSTYVRKMLSFPVLCPKRLGKACIFNVGLKNLWM